MGGLDRRFQVLVSAYGVSAFGNYLNLIALSLFSYEVTGTAFGVGLLMALRLLAGFTAALAAGALSARVTRRTVMVCTDLAQATAMATLALYADRTPLWLLAGAAVVLGAGNTLFTVSLRSAVPVMTGQEARARANGLLVTVRSLATVLGFASAAPTIGWGGYALAFAANGASFVVSAATLLVLRPRTDDGQHDGDEPGTSTGKNVSGRDGRPWHLVARMPALLLGMILLRGVDALASASHNVALPVVAQAADPAGPAVFMTRFWAAWAVGTGLAHLVLRRRRGEGAWSERAFALSTGAMSLSFVAAFLGLPPIALAVVAAAAGCADGWTEIVYTSRLQAVPDRLRSRLFGLSATAEQSGFALGSVAAASALDRLPALAVVGAFHGVALAGALTLLLCTIGLRDRGRSRPSPHGGKGEDSYGTHAGAGTLPGP